MNLKRILSLAGAIAAVAAAVAVCVIAASFAIYALAREYIGAAGGAAVVAVVFAIVAVIAAWLATRKVTPTTKADAPSDDAGLVGRLFDMAKERPLIALGAAAAAVTVLIRNPAVITAVVSAFVAGNSTAPPRK